MKKILFFILLILCLLSVMCNAYLVSDCPVEYQTLIGMVDGQEVQSDTVICSDSIDNCAQELNFFLSTSSNTYRIIPAQFSCSQNTIYISGVKCYYQNNDKVYCPLITDTSSFTDGLDTYIFPPSVPIYKFSIESYTNTSNQGSQANFINQACPLQDKIISGYLDGVKIETKPIICPDTALNCNQDIEITSYLADNLVKRTNMYLVCDRYNIEIDGIKCFTGGNSLYCPIVDLFNAMSFFDGQDNYVYPNIVPVFVFNVSP